MCHALARQGHSLILAGRDEVELNMLACDLIVRHKISCLILAVDFLSPDFTAESFIRNAGTFDHMIIATGTMGNGEPLSLSDIAFTSHINYTLPAQIATLGAIKFASPPLTPPASGGGDRGGHSIVIISSVAGDRGRQSNYAYGSAKAALSSFASGLRNYFCKHGVHIMTVKPGFVDTPMTWGMQSPLIASRDYVAEKIIAAMNAKKDVIYVPFFWRTIMLVIMHIPEGIFKKLKL